MKKLILTAIITTALAITATVYAQQEKKIKAELTTQEWDYHISNLNSLRQLAAKYAEQMSVADARRVNIILDTFNKSVIPQLEKQVTSNEK